VTKVGSVNLAGNHRKNAFTAVKNSLRRLRTNYIDVLYLHYWDFTTPPEEIMRALNDLVLKGKVHYLGVSDVPAWRVAQMNTLARERGWAEFVCYQGLYHFGVRDMELDIIPMCNDLGLGIVPWGVVGRGKWTGRFKEGKDTGTGRRANVSMTEKDYVILEVLNQISKEVDRSTSQICYAYMLRHYNWFPLIGATKLLHVEDAIHSLSLTLSEDQIHRIDSVATLNLVWPYDFIGTSLESNLWIKNSGHIEPRK